MNLTHKAEELQHEMKGLISNSDKPSGKVRLGTYTTASSYLLAEPVSIYLKAHKDVAISYSYDPVEVMLAKVKSKELDAAILSDFNGDASLEAIPLWKDRMVYVAAHEFAKELPDRIKPKDLAGISFLAYPLRYDLCYRSIEKNYGRYLSKARIVLESTSFDTLKQMLLNGAGGTFMPHYLVKDEIKNKRLKVIEIEDMNLPVEFSFISAGDAVSSAATSALKKQLLKWFRTKHARG